MQRSGWRGLVCVAICLTMASAALAQGQGRRGRGGFGGGGFGMGSAQLLGNEKIQKELKITDEQKEKLDALRREGRGGGGGFENFQNLSEEEREKAFAEFRQRAEERNKKAEALLNADQLTRLKQISLQVRGNAALNDEAVAKELALSEDQVAQVKTIGEAMGKQMQSLFQESQGADRDEMRKKFEELRKNADEEYLAVLTDEQKAKFAAMKGAKFDIDPAELRGGRGGPGGPGGRGGRRRGGDNS